MQYEYLNTILEHGLNITVLKNQLGIGAWDKPGIITSSMIPKSNPAYDDLVDSNSHLEKNITETTVGSNNQSELISNNQNKIEDQIKNIDFKNVTEKRVHKEEGFNLFSKGDDFLDNVPTSEHNKPIISNGNQLINFNKKNLNDKNSDPIKDVKRINILNKQLKKSKDGNNQTQYGKKEGSSNRQESRYSVIKNKASSSNLNLENQDQKEDSIFINEGQSALNSSKKVINPTTKEEKMQSDTRGNEMVNEIENLKEQQIEYKTVNINIPSIRNKTKLQPANKIKPKEKLNSEKLLPKNLKKIRTPQTKKESERLIVRGDNQSSTKFKNQLITKFDSIYPKNKVELPKSERKNSKIFSDLSNSLSKKQEEINTLKDKLNNLEILLENHILDQKKIKNQHLPGPPISRNLGGWTKKERSYFR